jgi:hypothetical protein
MLFMRINLTPIRIGVEMPKNTDSTHPQETKSQRPSPKERRNLIPGLEPAALASRLNERLPMLNAVIERKEKSQVVTQEVMLLEFNY